MSQSEQFDKYWSELRADVENVEIEWERFFRSHSVTSRGKTWTIDWIRFSSINDVVIEGWVSTPADHPANGAGFLWLPGYSYGTPPPDETNLVAGTVTLAINVHGNPPDAPYVNPAGKNDYILNGIHSPSTYIYRAIVGHCIKALDILLKQPGTENGIGVGGMSQGGGLALIVASQSKLPKICCADMPFLSDVRRSLIVSHSAAYKALKHHVEQVPSSLETVLLFDCLNHAKQITVPTWLSAGGKDPACRPETVENVYEALASSHKRYEFFPKAGHVFVPEMNAAYQEMIEEHILGS